MSAFWNQLGAIRHASFSKHTTTFHPSPSITVQLNSIPLSVIFADFRISTIVILLLVFIVAFGALAIWSSCRKYHQHQHQHLSVQPSTLQEPQQARTDSTDEDDLPLARLVYM